MIFILIVSGQFDMSLDYFVMLPAIDIVSSLDTTLKDHLWLFEGHWTTRNGFMKVKYLISFNYLY